MKKRILYSILNEWRDEDMDDSPIDIDDDITSSDMNNDEPDFDDDDFVLSRIGDTDAGVTNILICKNNEDAKTISIPNQKIYFNMFDIDKPFRRERHTLKDLQDSWYKLFKNIVKWHKFFKDNDLISENPQRVGSEDYETIENFVNANINDLGIYVDKEKYNFDYSHKKGGNGLAITISMYYYDFYDGLVKKHCPFKVTMPHDTYRESYDFTKNRVNGTFTKLLHGPNNKIILKREDIREFSIDSKTDSDIKDDFANKIISGIIYKRKGYKDIDIVLPSFLKMKNNMDCGYTIYFYEGAIRIYFLPFYNNHNKDKFSPFDTTPTSSTGVYGLLSDGWIPFAPVINMSDIKRTEIYYHGKAVPIISGYDHYFYSSAFADDLLHSNDEFFKHMTKLTHRWCFHDFMTVDEYETSEHID